MYVFCHDMVGLRDVQERGLFVPAQVLVFTLQRNKIPPPPTLTREYLTLTPLAKHDCIWVFFFFLLLADQSLLLRMKWLLKQQNLLVFGLKLNKYW